VNRRLTIRAAALAFVALSPAVLLEAAEARPKILILFDEDKDFPGLATVNRSLRGVFTSELGGNVELYSESLNLSQFRNPGHDGVLHDHFRRKYAGTQLDLVVAVLEPPLDFLLRHRDLFPGVPVVFCGVDASDLEGKELGTNVTGVLVRRNFAPTLDIALRLQPKTQSVFVVGGTSRFDRQLQAIARRDFQPFEGRVGITYVTELSMGDLLKMVSRLPPHSVVLYLTILADGQGRAFIPHHALSLITEAANAPVYVSIDQYLGLGAVGGHVYSLDTHGRQAAAMGLQILHGTRPASMSVAEPAAYAPMFDWRQLQRWGLDESQLPAGSVVSFRTPSAWDLYKWYIGGGATLLLLQSVLIARLLVGRAQRRRAQRALAERLRFETLLSEVSAEFLALPTSAVDHTIERMLRRVGEALDFDRAVVASREKDTTTMRRTHSWTRAGILPVPIPVTDVESFPWIWTRLSRGDVVEITELDALPQEAVTDRRSLAGRGICALAAVPVAVDGAIVGALAFSRLRGERRWPEGLIPRLRLLADVFATVLARKRADDAVRESEERRCQAEEEARRQRDELAHALRVATLGELTASIAHEINQPLSAILTNAQALLRSLTAAQAGPGEVEEVLTDIAGDTKRVAQTVQRLRALFRKEHAERTVIDVNTLIEDVLGLLTSDLQGKNIAVRFARGTPLPTVLGDPIQIRQVVLNVIINAGEAIALAEQGPREIQIDTGQPEAGCIAVAIRDSGVGVEGSDLERIFQPFVSNKPQGLGMGLAISRSIVEAHGGRIWAACNDDRGLTLNIELPGSDGVSDLVAGGGTRG
jgi:C4-dicarboxylate-specific signal transduction histidine kinase